MKLKHTKNGNIQITMTPEEASLVKSAAYDVLEAPKKAKEYPRKGKVMAQLVNEFDAADIWLPSTYI